MALSFVVQNKTLIPVPPIKLEKTENMESDESDSRGLEEWINIIDNILIDSVNVFKR